MFNLTDFMWTITPHSRPRRPRAPRPGPHRPEAPDRRPEQPDRVDLVLHCAPGWSGALRDVLVRYGVKCRAVGARRVRVSEPASLARCVGLMGIQEAHPEVLLAALEYGEAWRSGAPRLLRLERRTAAALRLLDCRAPAPR